MCNLINTHTHNYSSVLKPLIHGHEPCIAVGTGLHCTAVVVVVKVVPLIQDYETLRVELYYMQDSLQQAVCVCVFIKLHITAQSGLSS